MDKMKRIVALILAVLSNLALVTALYVPFQSVPLMVSTPSASMYRLTSSTSASSSAASSSCIRFNSRISLILVSIVLTS